MALSDRYAAHVALLVEVLPFLAAEPDFALKAPHGNTQLAAAGTPVRRTHRTLSS